MEQPLDVDLSWHMIVDWLAVNCPVDLASLQGPAAEERLDAIEKAVGKSLPTDQRAWWRLADGTDENGAAISLIPVVWTPLSTSAALTRYHTMLNFRPDEPELSQRSAEPAGSPCSWMWLPDWLPIAHNLGGDYNTGETPIEFVRLTVLAGIPF